MYLLLNKLITNSTSNDYTQFVINMWSICSHKTLSICSQFVINM